MIYRFKSAFKPFKETKLRKDMTYNPDAKLKNKLWIHWTLGGCWEHGGLGMMNIDAPKVNINPKARFWFTEKGYDLCAKEIIADAKKEGQILQVIKRKNPAKSQIVWQDEHQMAILPDKKKGKEKK